MKTYQAPWGKSLIVISSLLVVLAVACIFAVSSMRPYITPGFLAPFAQWLLPVIVLCCLPFMIRGYAITDDAILIRRLFWTTRLDRAGLKSAEVIPKAMSKSLRTCGNGGVFSFTGWYWSKSLGFYRAFVTDLNRTVVLRFGKRTVVVSPSEPEDFVNELNTLMPRRTRWIFRDDALDDGPGGGGIGGRCVGVAVRRVLVSALCLCAAAWIFQRGCGGSDAGVFRKAAGAAGFRGAEAGERALPGLPVGGVEDIFSPTSATVPGG